MSLTDTTTELPSALEGQPLERIERDGVEYVVLGTAHVSLTSVEAVKALLAQEQFDAIAIELCDSRAQGMRDPEAFKQMDLLQVIRQGKVGMVAASLVLSTFQKRLADQHGIQDRGRPGKGDQGGLDAHRRVEKQATDIGYRADAGMPDIQLVRVGLGIADELTEIFGRKVFADHEQFWIFGGKPDRLEVLLRIVA